jgi:hypothetical protein
MAQILTLPPGQPSLAPFFTGRSGMISTTAPSS